jgi:hypothetical protein
MTSRRYGEEQEIGGWWGGVGVTWREMDERKKMGGYGSEGREDVAYTSWLVKQIDNFRSTLCITASCN